MTQEQIDKFIQPHLDGTTSVQINFKARPSIMGIFIKTADFEQLRTKNLWRIVSESRITEYKSSKDISLARIFNGVEITRLTKD